MSRRSRLFVSTQVKDWGKSPLSRVPDTFFPGQLSPELWLDASDASTITASSGAVSQWNNKGSLGNFTQATGAVQPTTGATTQNSRNVIDFAADRMVSADAASSWKFLHDGTDYIIAAVWKAGTVADPNALIAFLGTNGAAGVGVDLLFDDRASSARNNRMFHRVGNSTSVSDVVSNLSADNFLTANTFAVSTLLVDPNNATAATRSKMFINGGSSTENNAATGTVSSGNPAYTLQIGDTGNNNATFSGSIAELVIVSGANATEANRTALRDYLNTKWAVY